MRWSRIALTVSGCVLLLSVTMLATRGLSLGIDFTGGTLIEAQYDEAVDLSAVRALLAQSPFSEAGVQPFGSSHQLLFRLPPQEQESEQARARLGDRLLETLRAGGEQEIEMRRIEFVGPQVGEELGRAGGYAMLSVLIGILLYIALRFQLRFSIGAIAALAHDVLVVLGFFSISGIDFDLPVLGALLAVVGYSLNDTIVVFDRIRENFRRMHKSSPVEVINTSLNHTLARTFITSLTTLMVLFVLLLLGGAIIRPFAATLIVGILIGTYSSLYIATTVTLALGTSRADLVAPAEVEDKP